MRSSHRVERTLTGLLLSVLLLTTLALSGQPKGHLLIVGGGERTDEIMQKFIQLAGGKDAVVVVFPMASTEPEDVGPYYVKQLNGLGVKRAFYLNINAAQANEDSTVAKLKDVTGVFYSGGDQVLQTKALLHTKTQAKVMDLYNNGAVIGGTSAGAAVMSKVMITGDELINKDSSNSFHTLLKDNVEVKEGFGFVTEAIVDQHFVVRKRHNRLISRLLQQPDLLGIAIDEATCIVVNPNRTFDVIGESVVFVYDPTNAKHIGLNKNNYLSGTDLKLHILRAGDSFDMKKKRPVTK